MKRALLVPLFLISCALGEARDRWLCWQHSGLDVTGQPETLAYFEAAVTPPGQTPTEFVQVPYAAAEEYCTSLNAWFSALAPGDYVLWVRAVDTDGNESEFATLDWRLDNRAPAPPGQLKRAAR